MASQAIYFVLNVYYYIVRWDYNEAVSQTCKTIYVLQCILISQISFVYTMAQWPVYYGCLQSALLGQ